MHSKKLTGLLPCLLLLCTACDTEIETITEVIKEVVPEVVIEEQLNPYNPKLSADSLVYNEIPEENKRLILQVDEPNSTVVNSSLRRFNTREIIRLLRADEQTLRLTSYSPLPVEKIDVYCRLNRVQGLDEEFLLFSVDSLPGFGELEYRPAFTQDTAVYRTESGRYLSFHQPYIDEGDITLTIRTDDAHYARLMRIKPSWTCYFSNYSNAGASWREMKAIYAREWVAIVTNLAYMVSMPEFEEVLNNYSTVMGGDLYGNGGVNDVFTPERYTSLFQNIMSNRTFRLGRTSGRVGLGGTDGTWGVPHIFLYQHYYDFTSWEIISHEFAHCLGFSHDSDLTYGSWETGFARALVPQMQSYLRRKGNLPYTDPATLDFTNPANEPYWRDEGVDRNWMNNPSTAENKIDKYFNANSIEP